MTIHNGYRIGIRDRNMIRLHPDEFSVLLVQLMDSQVATRQSALVHVPQVRELCEPWAGDVLNGPVAKKRREIEEDWQGEECPRREEERQEHLDCLFAVLSSSALVVNLQIQLQLCCESTKGRYDTFIDLPPKGPAYPRFRLDHPKPLTSTVPLLRKCHPQTIQLVRCN